MGCLDFCPLRDYMKALYYLFVGSKLRAPRTRTTPSVFHFDIVYRKLCSPIHLWCRQRNWHCFACLYIRVSLRTMITEEDHVPQLWECPAEMVKPSPGFCRRCPAGSSGPGKEGAVHAARHQSQPHLPTPHLGEMQAVILFFFNSSQEITSVPQGRSSQTRWLQLGQHRRAEHIERMKGTRHPRDRQGGQQRLSSSGSFCLFNILQTSSAGKAPAHSLEARLLLQR